MKTRHKNCLAHFSFSRSKRSIFYSLLLRSLVACVTVMAFARAHGQPAPGDTSPNGLDYNAPWPGDKAQDLENNYQRAMAAAHGALERGDYSKATSEANRALKFKPHDADALTLKQDVEKRRHEALANAEHEKSYRRAMVAAHAAFDRGQYDKALANANRALELKPDDADATELKGYIERRKGQPAPPPATVVITPVTPPPSTDVIVPVAPPPATDTVRLPPPGAAPAVDAAVTAPPPTAAPLELKTSKPARNQISFSGDYLLGQGNVT